MHALCTGPCNKSRSCFGQLICMLDQQEGKSHCTAVIRSGRESSQIWTNTARSKGAEVFCFTSGVEKLNEGREGGREGGNKDKLFNQRLHFPKMPLSYMSFPLYGMFRRITSLIFNNHQTKTKSSTCPPNPVFVWHGLSSV